MERLNFYLASASGYAKQATSIFNMFITVMFSSFAFAAALPLKNIGSSYDLFGFFVSLSSIWVGLLLLAFYIISFMSFKECSEKAESLIDVIKLTANEENLPGKVVDSFQISTKRMFGLGLPSVGFILGAGFSLVTFMWITNVHDGL
jgi:hypothetical protein